LVIGHIGIRLVVGHTRIRLVIERMRQFRLVIGRIKQFGLVVQRLVGRLVVGRTQQLVIRLVIERIQQLVIELIGLVGGRLVFQQLDIQLFLGFFLMGCTQYIYLGRLMGCIRFDIQQHSSQ